MNDFVIVIWVKTTPVDADMNGVYVMSIGSAAAYLEFFFWAGLGLPVWNIKDNSANHYQFYIAAADLYTPALSDWVKAAVIIDRSETTAIVEVNVVGKTVTNNVGTLATLTDSITMTDKRMMMANDNAVGYQLNGSLGEFWLSLGTTYTQ